MKKDYEFVMNDRKYKIKKVFQNEMYEEAREINDGKGTYFGKFLPYKQEIWLDNDLTLDQERKTLFHELMHCYIWCYMMPTEQFIEEDICYISSNSHDIIHEIISQYFKERV